ncbi:hypothetical protein [Gordonia spumicola]|nr:hypothetical protein [Gordonia spumicola]
MTTLNRAAAHAMPTVDVAGVDWPLNKVLAVVGGVLGTVVVVAVGGSVTAAAWTAVVIATVAWWGGYAWYGRRWDDGRREYAVESSREF